MSSMPGPPLVDLRDVSKAFGPRVLFRGVSLALHEGDRIGLIGPNGAGKTTLLKLMAGSDEPDDGTRTAQRGVAVGLVAQEPAFPAGATVVGAVEEGLLAARIDHAEWPARIALALGRGGFENGAQPVDELSGGWRKRLAIVRALAGEPNLLLLDEPTNHLDLLGVLWLEGLLRNEPRAFLAVTHDRLFLERIATRVIELNPVYSGGLLDVEGHYSDFLLRREDVLKSQAERQEALGNRVRREVEWLRRGPKARTTKAEARIREAERLIDEFEDLSARSAAAERVVDIDFTASGRKTRRLIEAKGMARRFGAKLLFQGLDLLLRPRQCLGLLGPNGSGKTTLLELLAGTQQPDAGDIFRAEGLQVVHFEQGRESLDPEASLKRALAPEGDTVVFRGRPMHVAGWAQRFLFRPDQLDQPVHRLSGGERARAIIARLMLRPADLLLLDEPTNDLDIPTLEVLEESLADFPGALVLVTHDRYLLDRLAGRILALDGVGGFGFFADLAQWEEARQSAQAAASIAARAAAEPKGRRNGATGEAEPSPKPAPGGVRKLSYLDQREWDSMEQRILEAEERLAAAEAALSDPETASNALILPQKLRDQAEAQVEVERLYARWAELEAKRGG